MLHGNVHGGRVLRPEFLEATTRSAALLSYLSIRFHLFPCSQLARLWRGNSTMGGPAITTRTSLNDGRRLIET
jgi:hypothetical protein